MSSRFSFIKSDSSILQKILALGQMYHIHRRLRSRDVFYQPYETVYFLPETCLKYLCIISGWSPSFICRIFYFLYIAYDTWNLNCGRILYIPKLYKKTIPKLNQTEQTKNWILIAKLFLRTTFWKNHVCSKICDSASAGRILKINWTLKKQFLVFNCFF